MTSNYCFMKKKSDVNFKGILKEWGRQASQAVFGVWLLGETRRLPLEEGKFS